MFSNIPSEIYGIPVWIVLLIVAALLLFFLKISGDSVNQQRYQTTRLFLYIAVILILIVGAADFLRWAQIL